MIKNPNWQEANQLFNYKCGRGVELETTEKQIQLVVRAGLVLGTSGTRVRCTDHSTAATWHNEPLFSQYPGITNGVVDPSNRRIYGKEPRFNDSVYVYNENILLVLWHLALHVLSRFSECAELGWESLQPSTWRN